MKKSDRILEKKMGSITFVVDRDLTAPNGHLEDPRKGQTVAEYILKKQSMSDEAPEIVAMSCPEATLYGHGQDVFFQTLVTAFAEHRPVVISPDMIWLLICQGFSQHINKNPEAFRDRLVDHEGREQLVVNINRLDCPTQEDWSNIIEGFSKQIEKKTKGSIASTLLSDFTTTGVAERVASGITLLDTVKPYFEYILTHCICGIPYITLNGTPEDWEKIIANVEQLTQFDLGWWTSKLIPILQEFVETAKGKPKASFWKSIVKTWRPKEMRGEGCGHMLPPATTVNGWFLKFFPYNRDGRTPEKVSIEETMLPETVSVPFIYKLTDESGNLLGNIPMNMTAGFIGIEEDSDTYALTPKIAWIISRSESEEDALKKLEEDNNLMRRIEIAVQEVPSVLRLLKHINYLHIHFIGKVNLPDWLDKIKIDRLAISGEITPEQKKEIKRRFPKCSIWEE
ncbi:MAG: DUF4419 domain-containing protein [Bacteroidales bacterium]|nr:DUF4419 domain-containing protein [Bacteroidales bacterium]